MGIREAWRSLFAPRLKVVESHFGPDDFINVLRHFMAAGQREIPAGERDRADTTNYLAYQNNPMGYNFVNAMRNFVFGPGFGFSHPDPAVQELINKLVRKEKFARKHTEFSNRYYSGGILYPILYIDLLTGDIKIREFDPYTVKEIATEDDYENVIGLLRSYTEKVWNRDKKSWDTRTVENEFVEHYQKVDPYTIREFFVWKRPTVGGETRGWSFFKPVEYYIGKVAEFIRTRLNVQKALAAYAWKWKITTGDQTSPEDKNKKVQIFRDNMATQGPPPPGSNVVTNEDVDLEAITAGVGASAGNAIGDYRALGLQVAVGFSVPEFVATGDASNANYSSLSLALQAFVKFIQAEQTIWVAYFGELWDAILGAWADARLITEEAAATPVSTHCPSINTENLRDIQALLDSMFDKKIIGRRGYAAATPFTVDYDREQEEIKKEEAAQPEAEEPPADDTQGAPDALRKPDGGEERRISDDDRRRPAYARAS